MMPATMGPSSSAAGKPPIANKVAKTMDPAISTPHCTRGESLANGPDALRSLAAS